MGSRALSYEEASARLASAARFGIHPSLDGIRALTDALGNPQHAFRVVQVAGTNGKGSTTRMTEAVLGAQGLRTGAYVSPHLHEYAEHVLLAGENVDRNLFAAGVSAAFDARDAVRPHLAEEPTEFELLTAAALWILREAAVEWAVLEVGMGGRWDSTSVARPEVSVVTSVGLDHVEHLGPTLEAIAEDKAYVIKPGSVGVLGPGTAAVDAVFARRAAAVGAVLVRVRELGGPAPAGAVAEFAITDPAADPSDRTAFSLTFPGRDNASFAVFGPTYQAENASCALVAATEALGTLDNAAASRALAAMHVPGRFELLDEGPPRVVVDGAHNAEGAAALRAAIESAFGGQSVTIVLGMLDDKPARKVVAALAPVASVFVVTSPRSSRALPAETLAAIVESATGVRPAVVPDVARSVAHARTLGADIVVAGSLKTVAEARAAVLGSDV